MAIYSPPNSFFNLNTPRFVTNCASDIEMCLPVYDLNDLLFYELTTTDYYVPSPNNVCTERVEWYGYRLVKSCNEPAPAFSILNYPADVTPYRYYQTSPTTWSLRTFDDAEFDLIIAQQQFDAIQSGECVFIQIIKTVRGCNEDYPEFGSPFSYTSAVVGCIGCFVKVADKCFTSRITYWSNEKSMGFEYNGQFYKNIVRLPFYLKQPQFLSKKNIFTLSNSDQKKLSARLEVEYNAETDYMPKEWHEKLVIALEHDHVFIENTNSNESQKFIHDGNYDIEWQDFLNHPTAKAKFKVKKIPYNNFNTNCNNG